MARNCKLMTPTKNIVASHFKTKTKGRIGRKRKKKRDPWFPYVQQRDKIYGI